MIGQTLGKYQLLKELGRGGFATVYQGFDAALERYVALKVLHPELTRDEVALRRFQREAMAVARLRHANVIIVYEFGEDAASGSAYIVMEFVEGDTLKSRLGKPIPLAETQRIIGDVASALEYAHGRGVIHRDIKPANILITHDNQVVLADFGIALLAQNSSSLTRGLLGTPQYMAPEQALGEPIDERSDLYALGVVLYEMLAGQPPFRGDSPLATLALQVNAPLPKLRAVNPAVPEAVEAMIERALAKDPAQRYPTAAEFRAALQAAAQSAQADMERATYSPDAAAAQQRQRAAQQGGDARLGGLPGLYQGMLEAAQEGDWQQVLELGRAIRHMDPNYRDVVALMARASAQAYAEQNRGGAIELKLLEQARVAWQADRWADAVQLFEQALRLAPPTAEVEEALTEARRRLADSEAQARLHTQLERRYIRATIYMDEQRWLDAVQEFDQIIERMADFRDVQELRARAHEKQAELERSTQQAFSAEGTVDRAREAMAAGEWVMACELLEQAAEAHPDDEALAAQLAQARVMVQVTELNATAANLVQQGRWAEAMEKMEEAKRLDPHYREALG
ncbi:MAG TPA: protein kinase [Chloroflexota bacterium]|nr:protein kinase [Chloroflexota bacterium]